MPLNIMKIANTPMIEISLLNLQFIAIVPAKHAKSDMKITIFPAKLMDTTCPIAKISMSATIFGSKNPPMM